MDLFTAATSLSEAYEDQQLVRFGEEGQPLRTASVNETRALIVAGLAVSAGFPADQVLPIHFSTFGTVRYNKLLGPAFVSWSKTDNYLEFSIELRVMTAYNALVSFRHKFLTVTLGLASIPYSDSLPTSRCVSDNSPPSLSLCTLSLCTRALMRVASVQG